MNVLWCWQYSVMGNGNWKCRFESIIADTIAEFVLWICICCWLFGFLYLDDWKLYTYNRFDDGSKLNYQVEIIRKTKKKTGASLKYIVHTLFDCCKKFQLHSNPFWSVKIFHKYLSTPSVFVAVRPITPSLHIYTKVYTQIPTTHTHTPKYMNVWIEMWFSIEAIECNNIIVDICPNL